MARHLITSAIPYINGIKHLGNLVGSQLPADLFARYQRARGNEVMFLCATDEHGTPAELAAAKAGKPVEEYCAEMHEVQAKIAQDFRLSFDHFGRSSSPQNHKLTQHFAGRLADAGMIREVTEKQMYSFADGRFLPDRYIEGTCPVEDCGYESARGDQCDVCTKQLDPTDLINPYSVISGSRDLEQRETKHLYLRQSEMREQLAEWIDSKKDWPVLTTSIAKKWLNDGDGLQDRGITRDLDWGVPVMKGDEPWPGMEGKVFYVWFDAPIEYIAAAQEWVDAGKGEDWERWWRTDKGADDVTYTQFMGKDNVPFHTLSFPVTIFGSGEPWKLVDYIKSFNYLNYDGGQFSTSRGRGVFMDQALEILPADYWRWWLLSHAPESSDAEFTWENFQTSVNKDLADVLGNFVSRVTKVCRSKFSEAVPEGADYGPDELKLIEELTARVRTYEKHMADMEVRKSAQELRAIWVAGNEYLQTVAPWSTFKEDPAKAAVQIRLALNLIPFYAVLSAPFIPDAAASLLGSMNAETTEWPDDVATALTALPVGHEFTVPEVTFRKITDDERNDWQERFAGTRG
ncbi:MAG: methionine--tRNA ligase [Pseudomonadota bacterium]|nr:methionine--tRNA ligase [Pseudomonadota bacterium]